MRICYVLSYRAPDYIRTRSLLSALAHLPGVECYPAINTTTGLPRYRETLTKVAHIQKTHQPDLYLLGFRGHELYWPLRRLVGERPIILDAMMSPSLALAEENKYGSVGRIAAALLTRFEKSILHNADGVLTDTEAHVQAFSQRYQLPLEKILSLPVGAVETAPAALNPGKQPRLRVLFYGSFLPLHGFETILAACAELKKLPLDLDFIGTTPKIETRVQQVLGQAEQLRYRTRRWVPFADILERELPTADLCLGGPFGNTPQARRVITGKTSQAMAQAIPTIVGETEDSAGFIHQKNCLYVPQGQAAALRDAIAWAHQNRAQLNAIGLQGQALYRQQLSLNVMTQKLASLLKHFQS